MGLDSSVGVLSFLSIFNNYCVHSVELSQNFSHHINTPTTRVCAIYRTPLGCYENLIRSDLFIYSSRRSVN